MRPVLVTVTALLAAAASAALAAEPAPPAAAPPAAAPDGGPADPASLPFGPEAVQAVFTAHHGEFRTCYEEVLAQGQDVQGEVLLAFVITPEGEASRVRVKRTTLGNAAVESCVAQAVRRWAFPRPKRPQPVEYPIRFDEVGGAPAAPGGERPVPAPRPRRKR